MEIIGKPTINPVLFLTGKLSGYISWGILVCAFLHIGNIPKYSVIILRFIAIVMIISGAIIATLSQVNLGKSMRLGLPSEITTFRTKGIYRISRNPMYIGFNCFTLAAILYTLNIIVILLGLYSMIIYHFIILGEEKFLENRFGNEYIEYKKKVKRYL